MNSSSRNNRLMADPSQKPEVYPGRGRVLRVKQGYNPNSSSLGSIIFSIPAALVAAPLLLAGAAAVIASRMAGKPESSPGTGKPPAGQPRDGES